MADTSLQSVCDSVMSSGATESLSDTYSSLRTQWTHDVAGVAYVVHIILKWKRTVAAIQAIAKHALIKAFRGETFKAGEGPLTKELLAYLLSQHHDMEGLSVTSCRYESLGTGTVGFLSNMYRLKLKYKQDDNINVNRRLILARNAEYKSSPPATLVMKCPGYYDAHFEQMAEETKCYEREHLFYTKLAPILSKMNTVAASDSGTIKFPLVYRSELNRNSEKASYILMEDLCKTCVRGNQIEGISPRRAEALVLSAAHLHASFWEGREGSAPIPDFVVHGDDSGSFLFKLQSDFMRTYPKLVASRGYKPFGAGMPEEYVKGVARRIYKKSDWILSYMCKSTPQTLIHADYRADNMMHRKTEMDSVVVDWQMYCRAAGVYDVCNILIPSMCVGERREHCVRLVRLYHNALVERGVVGYSWENLWHDFRMACLQISFLMGILSTGIGDHGELKQDFSAFDLCSAAFQRVVFAISDYNCLKLIS